APVRPTHSHGRVIEVARRGMGTAFFFQAEAGIRDGHVTGVQTCALPIYGRVAAGQRAPAQLRLGRRLRVGGQAYRCTGEGRSYRSEERRVGKEWRSRWSAAD